MSKKGNRFIYIPLISFLLLFGCPFTISADNTIVPTFAGTSSQTDWNNAGGHLTEYHESSSNNTGISKLNFSFDNHYYGIVSITYYFGPSTYSYGDVFIADGYGEFYYRNSSGSYNYVTAVRIDMVSLVIPDSNVDLSQIITILTAIQGNTSNTVLEIQNVLDELIISNGYLETLTEIRDWNFPIESYSFNYILLKSYDYYSIRNLDYYTYPIFHFNNQNTIFSLYIPTNNVAKCIFIFNRNINNLERFNQYFNLTGCDFNLTYRFLPNNIIDNQRLTIVTIDMQGKNDNAVLSYINSSSDLEFIGIYLARSEEYRYVSTDFALRWGLSNPLLDNLNIIANGTTQSNSAAGSNDTATNEFEEIAGDMYDYEDSFNSDMNSSLNQIDTNFNIGSQFGSKFSASAQWVSQQFNTLTASTPFGSVISFSLLLGLALLIIGKVLR